MEIKVNYTKTGPTFQEKLLQLLQSRERAGTKK